MTDTSLPTHVKAAILKEIGSKYEIESIPLPELEEDEVLIKLEAAGEWANTKSIRILDEN